MTKSNEEFDKELFLEICEKYGIQFLSFDYLPTPFYPVKHAFIKEDLERVEQILKEV